MAVAIKEVIQNIIIESAAFSIIDRLLHI